MAGVFAHIPFDGGASAVMQGVAVLLQVVSLVKRNLSLMVQILLAAGELKKQLGGLETCLR